VIAREQVEVGLADDRARLGEAEAGGEVAADRDEAARPVL
jgi:hypothetical protein